MDIDILAPDATPPRPGRSTLRWTVKLFRLVLSVPVFVLSVFLGAFAFSVVWRNQFDGILASIIVAAIGLAIVVGLLFAMAKVAAVRFRSTAVLFLAAFLIGLTVRLTSPRWLANHWLSYNLRVGYLYDDRFPSLSGQQLHDALEHAEAALADEFDFTFVRLGEEKLETVAGEQVIVKIPFSVEPIESAFDKWVGDDKTDAVVLDPFNPQFVPMTDNARKNLESISLAKLRELAPEDKQGEIRDYDAFYRFMFARWIERAKDFTNFEVDGVRVFTPDTLRYQTHSGWKLFFERQRDYDVVLTNTLIFDDWVDDPYPHTILTHAKIGGLGRMRSGGAPSGMFRGTLVSTIGFAGLPPFAYENVSEAALSKQLGVFLIAHELGHTIAGLRDNYDHERHCLMFNHAVFTDVRAAMSAYDSHKGPCPKCLPELDDAASWHLKLWPAHPVKPD